VEKSRKDVELTKVKYEESLVELNAYNAKYREDMTEVYNRTQEFEEKRLTFFKKVLYSLHTCLDLTQNSALVSYVFFSPFCLVFPLLSFILNVPYKL